MSLAATGALTSTALAAAHMASSEAAIAVSSAQGDASQSSFAMAESHPKYKVIPVPGGMLVRAQKITTDSPSASHAMVSQADFQQPVEAGIAMDGLGVIGVLLLFSVFPAMMNFITRTRQIVDEEIGGKKKKAAPEPEFTPFFRRGEEVSIFNPVRIGGEELPGRAVKDPASLGNIFGKKGIL